ncbi:MAG: hypothetical protein E7349_07550, partial [Clostridiales bacterium]|nr:hypothetical protein [Clostridiales bacterium]
MKNTVKKICILALSFLMSFSIYSGFKLWQVTAATNTVYVSANGSNSNAGTEAAPYGTFQYALSKVENGGTIVLQDSVA